MTPTDDDKTTPFIRDEGTPANPVVTPAAGAPAPRPLNLQHRAGVVGAGFMQAKTGKRVATLAIVLITVLVVVHLGAIGASWASTVWAIDRLPPPDMSSISNLALAPTPPPPPPPPPGGAKPKTEIIKPKKPTVKELVQPVKIEKQEKKEDPGPTGDVNGVEGGEEGGVEGGVVGGVQGSPPPPPPPPPPPAPPQNVPPTMLEGQRIAGNKMIVPNDVTKTEIQRSGKDKVVGSFKLCITVDGNVSSINMLKGTGFGAYDAKIQGEMRQWRYRPYMVNGKAVPVCTAVTFIYSQN
jgi:protein TonB